MSRQPIPNNAPYAAVVFDLDGTLVDTEAVCIEAGLSALSAAGLPPDRAFFDSLSGVDDANRLIRLEAMVGPRHDALAIMDDWNARFAAALEEGVPMKPGALDLLAHLAASVIPVALATSSQRAQALRKLHKAGLADAFAAVVTVDDVARAKPAPDPYLLAARQLSVDPLTCLAFEDSDPGTLSAREAGMRVVQVPDGPTATGRHAHHVAHNLLDGARWAGLFS